MLNYLIRIPPKAYFLNGTALCWILWSTLMLFSVPKNNKALYIGLSMVAVGTLVDNVFFDLHTTGYIDYVLFGMLIGSVIAGLLQHTFYKVQDDDNRVSMFSGIFGVLAISIMLFSRNYVFIHEVLPGAFNYLYVPFDTKGTIFFHGDAWAWFIAATATLSVAKGANKVVAVYFLILTTSNLIDRLGIYPKGISIAEVSLHIYYNICLVFSLLLYKYKDVKKKFNLILRVFGYLHLAGVFFAISDVYYLLANIESYKKITTLVIMWLLAIMLIFRKQLKKSS